MFQFQSGAIKSKFHVKPSAIKLKFQFQSGAIKSPADITTVRGLLPCFNSNLVRLKVAKLPEVHPVKGGFNSNLVRLKGAPAW